MEPIIKGENREGDLRRFLTRLEAEENGSVVRATILSHSGEGKTDWRVSEIGGLMFISTLHPRQRIQERTYSCEYEVLNQLSSLLRRKDIMSQVMRNPIEEDAEGNIHYADEGCGMTAIADRSGLVFLMEAGYSYVRLVTVWNSTYGTFYAKPGTRILKVQEDGKLLFGNRDYIPEVSYQLGRRNKNEKQG